MTIPEMLGRFEVPGHYTGDCRALLADLPDACVQMCVTSPPYWGLRDYGVDGQLGLEPTPDAFVANLVDVFRGVRRVLRDDGTLWLNIGDSYAAASKGSGGMNGSIGNGAGQRTNAGPMYGERRFDLNASGLKAKDLVGAPWMVAFALRADGWYLRSDIIWHKPNPMPESVTDRPTKAHEYLFLLSKSPRYLYDHDSIKEQASGKGHGGFDAGDGVVLGRASNPNSGLSGGWRGSSTRNRRSVWTVAPQPYHGAHFAAFPPKLIEPCIMAGSRPGDVVLDPFFGSGTTGEVAKRLGRRWLGFDLNPAYEPLQRERTS